MRISGINWQTEDAEAARTTTSEMVYWQLEGARVFEKYALFFLSIEVKDTFNLGKSFILHLNLALYSTTRRILR